MDKIRKVRFKGYKGFRDENTVTLGEKVTLFIGKNNSGKSSAVDVIESAFHPEKHYELKGEIESLKVSFEITENHIASGFSKSISGGNFGENYYTYGMRFVGQEVFLNLSVTDPSRPNTYPTRMVDISENQGKIGHPGEAEWGKVARSYVDCWKDFAFRRIDAERDIRPEIESSANIVESSGDGATNLIRLFVNNSSFDESVVENKILDELNIIMYPEASFDNIRVQQVESSEGLFWEVFLSERGAKRFALSKSGSGLKTILLTLVNLYLIPELKEYKGKSIVYAFEELENNLHPALQRKLFDYLYQYTEKTNNRIVLTTHSHVAINSLFGKEGTVLYHVVKSNNNSQFSEISSYIDKVEILDDLDVKASDILQSNGIIWVEGPSDRIYIKRWLDVFCNCRYVEGRDYQFLYYGGRLLSHYTADSEGLSDLINILTTNRNAAIVIDSDKKSKQSHINDAKKRIKEEFEKNGLLCWITKGKEIENYLPGDALEKRYGKHFDQIGQFELFPDYVKEVDKTFSSHKVDFAKEITEYILLENSKEILDLEKEVNHLYKEIHIWNS